MRPALRSGEDEQSVLDWDVADVTDQHRVMTTSSTVFRSILDLRHADSAVVLLVYRGDW